MTSAAKIRANRRNALRSTGLRSPAPAKPHATTKRSQRRNANEFSRRARRA
jgi:hypothetical protein